MPLSARRTLFGLAVCCVPLAACFALFPLDGYGPGGVGDDAAADGPPPDGASLDARSRPDGRIVFLTRAAFAGDFGGIDGGDSICLEAGAGATFPGRYLAWLSDDTTSPLARFGAAYFDGGARAIVMMDGELVATSLADLADAGPRAVIAIDEHAARVELPAGASCSDLAEGGLVWSDTTQAGTSASGATTMTCSRWTSQSGSGPAGALVAEGGASGWTSVCQEPCAIHAHLYCFEQP